MLGISSSVCGHSNHLFANPLCDSQSIQKRVANVAFHVFTMGIPLLFHYLFFSSKGEDHSNLTFSESSASANMRIYRLLDDANAQMKEEIVTTIRDTHIKYLEHMTNKFTKSDRELVNLVFNGYLNSLALSINEIYSTHMLEFQSRTGLKMSKNSVKEIMEEYVAENQDFRILSDIQKYF